MEIKFDYIAAWKDGSKQNWSLTAQSEAEARAKLHSMQFSVLKLKKVWETNVKENIWNHDNHDNHDNHNNHDNLNKIYEFAWFKLSWEDVNWSIEAKNEITALKRLYDEYKFNITWIVDKDLSPAIKEHKKKWSIDRILAEAFDEWIFIKAPELVKDKDENEVYFGWVSKEERDAIEDDVKKYLSLSKELSKNCNWIIWWVDLNILQKKFINLEKIQKSNNIPLIQTDLEDLLKFISKFFNDKNKEDLPDKSLRAIDEISSYLWINTNDFITEKILPFLEKFSFLKDYLKKIKKYLEINKDSDLIQKKSNLIRYVKRFFLHLRLFLTSTNKEEREKRLSALKKTFSLITSTYKTYSLIRKTINKNKEKYYSEFRRWNFKLYNELRFISSLILFYYFIYFIFIDFWLRKWIFIDYKLWYFTIWSNFVLTILFATFLINFLSLIKVKYFLKNIYFNLFLWLPVFILATSFFYINY